MWQAAVTGRKRKQQEFQGQKGNQQTGAKSDLCRGKTNSQFSRLQDRRAFRQACACLGEEVVPGTGIEPVQPCGREILSLLCLPISPSGLSTAIIPAPARGIEKEKGEMHFALSLF
jgi:hypothetical protein